MTHVFRSATGFLQFLVVLFGSQQTCLAQTIRYVSTTGTNANPAGATSTNSLQGAINASAVGDQVWVAIYGGFASTETNLNQRPAVNPLTGRPSSSTLNGSSVSSFRPVNNYHIISNPPGLGNIAVLDGFVMTGGEADNPNGYPQDQGGRVYNDESGKGNFCSPTFRNCAFIANKASVSGGAMCNARSFRGSSNPALINLTFHTNSAITWGGDIYNFGPSCPRS